MSWAARRAGSLSASGAVAATIIGGLSIAAGWGWGVLLIGWFVASSALTRLGHDKKLARVQRTLAPTTERRAIQVMANGAVFAAAALIGTLTGEQMWWLMAVAALGAAAADTWATEIGLLWGGKPRSILTGRPVEAGMSGGVTLAGTLGAAAGALAVALAGSMLVPNADWVELSAAGFAGGLGDSLLGASVQTKRWCAACAAWTERVLHDCGASTTATRGWGWMTNDTVNLLATLIGAVSAVLLHIT